MKTWTVIALLVLGAMRGASAQSAWKIVSIHGVAYIRASPTAPREKLTPTHDQGRSVSYDDEISCERGGLVTFQLTKGISYAITGPSPWTPLPHLSSAAAAGLDEYYRRGGRERGDQPAILTPAPDGQIWPETLTFRWTQRPGVTSYTLSVFSPARRLVWQQLGIGATTGMLVSPSARQALSHVSPAERQGQFILVLQDQYNRLQVTGFHLAP